jgi:hypothetical protein
VIVSLIHQCCGFILYIPNTPKTIFFTENKKNLFTALVPSSGVYIPYTLKTDFVRDYVRDFVRDYGNFVAKSETVCAMACTDRETRGDG